MSKSYNKAFFMGNVGVDPKVKEIGNGNVVNFSLASTKRYKDKNGNLQEKTDWHNIVAFGRNADNIAKYVKKGSSIFVECEHRSGSYEKDGQKVNTSQFEVTSFQLLDSYSGDSKKKVTVEADSKSLNEGDEPPF